MVFAEPRRPAKPLAAFGIVAVLHVALAWALLSGLARKVVDVVKAPIETKLIEEVKPPPPPPENLPPPPKNLPPPPSFVPPPEVVVTPPPVPQQTITTTTVAPPPAPVAIAPAAPEAPPAPAPAARAAVIDVRTCETPNYPAAALKAEATGLTRIRFTVDAIGKMTKAEIEKPSGPSREHRLMDRAAVDALGQCRFKPGLDAAGNPVGAYAVVEYSWTLK